MFNDKSVLVEREGEISSPMFKAVVANPPYQKQTGKNTSIDIYQFFQQIASSISDQNSLLYSGAWKKDVSEEDTFLGRFLIDNGVYTVYSYTGLDLFGDHIAKNFALTIVACKKSLKTNTNTYYSGPIITEKKPIFRPVEVWNTREDTQVLLDRTKTYPTHFADLVQDIALVSNLKDSGIAYSVEKTEEFDSPILVKSEPGVGSRAEFFYIRAEDHRKTLEDCIPEYKVIMQASPLGRLSHWYSRVEKRGTIRTAVLSPETSFGKTFVLLRTFKNSEEAKNFSLYMNSTFALRLGSLNVKRRGFGRFIPDLCDYTDNNPLFSSDAVLKGTDNSSYLGKTLDERLYIYFGLKDDEIAMIESEKKG